MPFDSLDYFFSYNIMPSDSQYYLFFSLLNAFWFFRLPFLILWNAFWFSRLPFFSLLNAFWFSRLPFFIHSNAFWFFILQFLSLWNAFWFLRLPFFIHKNASTTLILPWINQHISWILLTIILCANGSVKGYGLCKYRGGGGLWGFLVHDDWGVFRVDRIQRCHTWISAGWFTI